MSLGKLLLSVTLVFTASSFLFAADEPKPVAIPATQPAEVKPTKKMKVTEPWSMLKDLTPEQITQIEKIHGDALAQADKIKAKERDDITALLTPQQVTELKIAEAKKALQAKEAHAEKLKEAATSQPAER